MTITPLEAAVRYTHDRYSVIPVPYRSKDPGFTGWPQVRLTEADLPRHFNGKPQNIGLLLGEPSNWLIDIDIDHPVAIELAYQCLPPTPAVFGRPSKPRSHWLYRVTAPIQTKQFRIHKLSIVEIRSTGLQTVVPPSTHESGELITWEAEEADPAEIHPDSLLAAVQRLYEAVLERLGEKPRERDRNDGVATNHPSESAAWNRALQKMLRIKAADGKDGSRRLLAVACRAVEHDLKDDEAIRCIRALEKQRPFPIEWTDDEIIKRLRSAEGKCTRGEALHQAAARRVLIGTDEHRVIDETIRALSADPDLYHRGGMLARALRRSRDKRAKPSIQQGMTIQH